MKRFLFLLALPVLLAACVDTTGLSAQTTRPVGGNPQSSVVVSEFADLQCPSCRAAQAAVVEPLLAKYGTQIRYEFRHFPLRSIHRYAMDMAEGAECAADQQKFWEFIELAFEKQPEVKKGSVEEWAKTLGLDMDLFNRCTSSHIKRDLILAEYDQGAEAGVTGTPTFFVNGQRVDSNMDAISAAVDAALKGAVQRL